MGEFESSAVKVEKETSQHYAKIIKVSLRIPYSSHVGGRPAEAEVATDSGAGEDEVPVTEPVTASTAKPETATRKPETGCQEPKAAGQHTTAPRHS